MDKAQLWRGNISRWQRRQMGKIFHTLRPLKPNFSAGETDNGRQVNLPPRDQRPPYLLLLPQLTVSISRSCTSSGIYRRCCNWEFLLSESLVAWFTEHMLCMNLFWILSLLLMRMYITHLNKYHKYTAYMTQLISSWQFYFFHVSPNDGERAQRASAN